MAATLRAAFATAVWMVDRVHRRATDVRPNALPAVAPRLADHHVHRVGVAHLTDCRPARGWNAPDFAAGKRDLGPIGLAGHQRRARPGRAAQLRPAARLHLDAVNVHAQRNTAEWQAISHVRRRIGAILDRLTDRQTIGSDDVPLLAIDEVQQGDPCVAVRVVLDRRDLRCYSVLVPLEVDQAILLLVPAATVPDRDSALVVPPALLAERPQERLFGLSTFRQLRKITHARPAAASGNRIVLLNAHFFLVAQASRLCIRASGTLALRLEDVDPMLRIERHDRLLPGFGLSLLETVLPRLAAAVLCADLIDLDVEQLLDGPPHVVLRRLQVHLERVLVVPRRAVHPFFRHQRAENHLIRLQPRLLGCLCLFSHVSFLVEQASRLLVAQHKRDAYATTLSSPPSSPAP